jgi:hypothetical protein
VDRPHHRSVLGAAPGMPSPPRRHGVAIPPAVAGAARPRPPGWYEGYEDVGRDDRGPAGAEGAGAGGPENWLAGGVESLSRWLALPRWNGGQSAFGWPP